ncbi:autotransporter domain-containing protein [Maricaulis parjimensis]|uniref:autotransporter domain-containing protein n=1 Tax=Maricaulis parjimensis TaxID=144023 RepID=UPI00193A2B16|nr:autotransporter domain-containing protein [Maricaulis parjimensis]
MKLSLLAGVASLAISAGAEAQTVCTPTFEDVLFGLTCTGDQGSTPVTFDTGDFIVLDGNWTSTATAIFEDIPYQVFIHGDIDTSASLASAVILTGGAGGSTYSFHNRGSLVSGFGTTVQVAGDYELGGFLNNGDITGDGIAVSLSGVTGDVVNNGSIRGSTGLRLGGPVGGSILNFGDLTAGAFGLVVLGDVGGDVFNAGTIASDTSLFGLGVQLSGNIGGIFYNGGIISSNYFGVLIDSDSIAGVFENTGDIIADVAVASISSDSSVGGFRNSGTITGYTGGIQLSRVLGSIENRGSISAGYGSFYISGLVSGNFENSGYIGGTSELGNQFGLQFFTGLAGRFENTGRISGNYAVSINALGGYFYNGGTGEIVGNNSGVYIGDFGGPVFLNDGLIQASGFGVALNNSYLGQSFIENTGTILGEQLYGLALVSTDPASAQTAFIQNWGLIQGGDQGVFTAGHDQVSILNLGIIQATNPDGVAISAADSIVEVFNGFGGVIEGEVGIEASDGQVVVVNSGTIRGLSGPAMDLGDGDSLVINMSTGHLVGDLIGGGGRDELVLNGGTYFLDMLIDGFEEVVFLGIGTGSRAGQTYVALRRDLIALEEGRNSGWLDIADHTFEAQNFENYGTLVSRGGTIDASLFNAGELLGSSLTVTGDVINLTRIDPAGTGIGTFTFQGDFFNLAEGEEFSLPSQSSGMTASAEPLTPASITSPQDGTLIFDVSGTTHDQLIIGGAASINGTIALRGDWTELARSRQTASLITAAGGMSGSPDLVATAGLLFTPQLSLSANSLDLIFQAADFATALAPSTYNQTQAALGLQARWNAGASAVDDLILALNAGLASGPVLQGLSAEEVPAVMRAGARQGSHVAQAVSDCALGRRGSACNSAGNDQGVTLWASYTTGSATLVADSNAADVEESFGVATQGVQYALSGDLAVGGFIAAGRGQARVGDAIGNGTVDSLGGGLYGSARFGGLGLALTAGYADLDIETGRATPGGRVEGSTGGSVAFARLDARLQRESGAARYGIDLSGRYAYSEIDAHSQMGASLYTLDVHSDGFRSLTWTADAFVEYTAAPTQTGHHFVFGASGGFLSGTGEDAASGILEIPGAGQAYEVRGPATGIGDLGMQAGGFVGLQSAGGDLTIRVSLDGYRLGEESGSQASARIAWRF